jgi:hypothetical protein
MSSTDDNSGRDVRGRFTRNDDAPPPAPAGKGKRVNFKHFTVDELLPEERKADYEKLMRDPRTTVPALQEFLRKLGIVVSRNAVAGHRLHAHLEVKRVQEMSLMAKAFCELVRSEGATTVAEASHAKFEMKLMEFLFKDKDTPVLDAAHFERMGKVTQRAVQTRMDVEAMHQDAERRDREAREEAEKARQPQKSRQERNREICRRMDEIMGITRPNDFYDEKPNGEQTPPPPADGAPPQP